MRKQNIRFYSNLADLLREKKKAKYNYVFINT